jgi:hypothetical protein
MKKTWAALAGFVLLVSAVFPLHGLPIGPLQQPVGANNVDLYSTNTWWLQLTGVTNDTVSLAVNVPVTATNSILNLYFTTNCESCSWSRVLRLVANQTNLIVTNLSADHGFFTLNSPIRPGFAQQTLPANDDSSTPPVSLPFTINFFGTSEPALYVNNNGNVTFGQPLTTYTPETLAAAKVAIIAPFWADVDTRSPSPGVVQYGTNIVDSHSAFGVNWVNVGYYSTHADRLLSCQLVIIDRADIAPGNFDMEFNYDRVEWEAGDVSGGSGGYWIGPGGGSARAGFSDGITDHELTNSGLSRALLDTNLVTGLVYSNLSNTMPGRYLFHFRNGQPMP